MALVAHDIHDHGGMEKAFAELIRRTHASFELVVISGRLAEDLRPFVEWRRLPLPQRPFALKLGCFFLLAGARLGRLRADVVHTLGAIVPNRVDVATVHFCQAAFRDVAGGLAVREGSFVRWLNRSISRALSLAVERWCYRPRKVRMLAPVSRGVARELRRYYPGIPVAITPNGVDTERFRPDAQSRAQMRRQHGLRDDELVVLFVGGAWERKGLAVAVEGVARAKKRGAASLRLWVVGRGDERRIRRLAARCGVEGDIRLFGARAETERFYQAADVFVLPTLYETFSLVAYEAAACGLPVVATPANGIAELIGDDEAGFSIERSADALASALCRLASDPRLRRRMGQAGRRRVRDYTWARSVESVVGLYDGFAGEGSRRA